MQKLNKRQIFKIRILLLNLDKIIAAAGVLIIYAAIIFSLPIAIDQEIKVQDQIKTNYTN